MKKLLLLSTLLAAAWHGIAQNYTDALRYSRNEYLGTARFNAMGGSFGALGGEVSGISINPAGLGVYRNSEFTFSTAFNYGINESNFRSNLAEDSKLNFNLSNIAYVAAYKGDPNGWKNFSISFGYNRLASFHNDLIFQGESRNGSSIIDDYVFQLNSDQADVLDVEEFAYPFGASHAYWNYMINPTSNNSYAREVTNTSSIIQNERVKSKGSMNETFFAVGGNFKDRLYLGTQISIVSASFDEERTFSENYIYAPAALPQDSVGVYYEERTDLIARGTGFTAKFGAIYKVNQALRLGAAIHIPTFWGIREEYSFNSESQFSEGTVYDQEQETFSNWEYKVRSPFRYIGSIGYTLQQKAAFNFDYEYVDYSSMNFDDKNNFEYNYTAENNTIREILRGTHNIRFGVEYLLNPFVVRGGFRYEDNPFNTSELALNPDQSRKTYSLGGGFRSGNTNFDVTYMLSNSSSVDPVYQTSDAAAQVDQDVHRLILTIGWKW